MLMFCLVENIKLKGLKLLECPKYNKIKILKIVYILFNFVELTKE